MVKSMNIGPALLLGALIFICGCDQKAEETPVAEVEAPVETAPVPDAVPVATSASEAQIKLRLQNLPNEAREYVSRRAGCNHWGGEPLWEGTDAQSKAAAEARKAQIENAWAELRCEQLDADKAKLKECYKSMVGVSELLDMSDDWGAGDDYIHYLASLAPAPTVLPACL